MTHTRNITTSSNLSMVSYHLSMVIVGASSRGRTVKVIENDIDGVASETETDTDRITEYAFDHVGEPGRVEPGFGQREHRV